jgi:hypothetical protein
VLVEISFSSVGGVSAYNVRGLGIESHHEHCIFPKKNHMLYYYLSK